MSSGQPTDGGHGQQPGNGHGQPLGSGRSRPSRRAVLLGSFGVAVAGGAAVAYELVQAGALPGKYALANLDGACGTAPPPPHGALPAQSDVTFNSAYRHRSVTMVTLLPAGVPAGAGLGVVVGLHGAGGDARQFAGQLRPALTAARIAGLAAVTVDGGDTYWHKRADGDDPVGMITQEVLPRLAAAGLRTARIAIIGVSMGGYGALLLAEQLARPGARRHGCCRAVTSDLHQLRRSGGSQPGVIRQSGRLRPARRAERRCRAAARTNVDQLRH